MAKSKRMSEDMRIKLLVEANKFLQELDEFMGSFECPTPDRETYFCDEGCERCEYKRKIWEKLTSLQDNICSFLGGGENEEYE